MANSTAQATVLPPSQANGGAVQNNYQIPVVHWVQLNLSMNQHEENGSITQRAVMQLPYVWVCESDDHPNQWTVVSTGVTGGAIGNYTPLRLALPGVGRYRAYIREPGLTINAGTIYNIPFHALTSAEDSDREVQPWLALTVTAGASPQTRTVIQQLPNAFGRATAEYPSNGTAQTLNQTHTQASAALNLGLYTMTRQLWADASRTYGAHHPAITGSTYRQVLETLYREQFPESATHTVTLTSDNGTRTVEFNPMATVGGRTTRTFLANNGQPSGLMTARESLRRTHPLTAEKLLAAMTTLNIHYALSTGAWRPHYGSTLHRYASALDVTHLRTRVNEENGTATEVRIHLHRIEDPEANPLNTDAVANTLAKRRKRDFSLAFHRYLGERKQAGELGWLGGPWQLTYTDVGLQGNAVYIKTDDVHKHHVHISIP